MKKRSVVDRLYYELTDLVWLAVSQNVPYGFLSKDEATSLDWLDDYFLNIRIDVNTTLIDGTPL